MTQFHAGLHYTAEQQHELDGLYQTWLDRDASADWYNYENRGKNAAAEEAWEAYELAKETIDRIHASNAADKLVPVIRQGLQAQFGRVAVEAVQ